MIKKGDVQMSDSATKLLLLREKRKELVRQYNATRREYDRMSIQNPKREKLEKIMASKLEKLSSMTNLWEVS